MLNNNYKLPWKRYVLSVALLLLFSTAHSGSMLNFLNNKTRTSIRFELEKNLIIIPVKVNDMDLRLILDTGVRSVILFGKKFEKKLSLVENIKVHLNGYGKKKKVTGKLCLENEITISDVLGTNLGVVITKPPYDLKMALPHVDGVIGYEIFSSFVVKINYPNRLITLYEPANRPPTHGYETLPLIIKDTKPYIPGSIQDSKGKLIKGQFHVDTGSANALMLFMDDKLTEQFKRAKSTAIGIGIGGQIMGYEDEISVLSLGDSYKQGVTPKYVKRKFSDKELQEAKGNIGSGYLKQSIIIFDYMTMQFHIKNSSRLVPPQMAFWNPKIIN